jgi:hypothetical protein
MQNQQTEKLKNQKQQQRTNYITKQNYNITKQNEEIGEAKGIPPRVRVDVSLHDPHVLFHALCPAQLAHVQPNDENERKYE